ncbi:MAG: contact-dependent growth inhibition system immunity protein [Gemmatirosa sp.]
MSHARPPSPTPPSPTPPSPTPPSPTPPYPTPPYPTPPYPTPPYPIPPHPPIGQLGPAEPWLLGHGCGLRWALPLALERLECEPFVAGDRGPGDLLTAALSVDPAEWAREPESSERLARVVHAAREQVHRLREPTRTRLADYRAAARGHFGYGHLTLSACRRRPHPSDRCWSVSDS